MSQKTVFRAVDRWIDDHEENLVDLASRLIRIDTTVPPGHNYEKIAKVLAGELRELGTLPAISPIPPPTFRQKTNVAIGLEGPRPNVYATLKGERTGPKIVLNGHIDVVPAQKTGWKYDPFKPKIVKGALYGRGSADMKGADACMLYSMKALVETGVSFSGSITLTYTTDEEVGGYTGVNHLVDTKVITKNFDYGLSPDSGMEAVDIASLGDIEFVVRVQGRSAHSGRGWTGVNAIDHATALVERYKKLAEEIGRKRSRIRAEPIYGNRWMRPGLYVTMIKGGIKGNIIPDQCEILVDRRFIPEEKPDIVKAEIATVAKEYARENPDVKVVVEPLAGYQPMVTPSDHPLVKLVKREARKVLGVNVPACGSQGSTDMATVSMLGIPVAILGTTRAESNIHGVNEHVWIRDLISITKIFAHCYIGLLSDRSIS